MWFLKTKNRITYEDSIIYSYLDTIMIPVPSEARGFTCFKEALEMKIKDKSNELKYFISGREGRN